MTSKSPPSSSLTPPPRQSETTKYLIVVVLLGAGLAGLLFWKNCSSKPEPVALNPVTSSIPSSPPPPKEDDVPPPPPIEDAGPEGGGHHFVGNPCDVRSCSGAVSSDLETALAFRAKQAHRCYDTALTQDQTIQGHVTISVRVAANGQVCGANLASNDLSTPSVGNCIANMFRSAGHFPPPKGGCVDTNVPIALLPPGQH